VKRILSSKSVSSCDEDLAVMERLGGKFAEMHALGIAIGDTKPENIVIGKNGEAYLLDLEQSSRNGDKVWDVAEFLYYSGHYVQPFASTHSIEVLTKAFVKGYLNAGGSSEIVKKMASPKYTKVFSVFTLPLVMIAISNVCRKVDKQKE